MPERIVLDFDAADDRLAGYSIASSWQNFRTQVVPLEAQSHQVEATRDAFYAGYACCLLVMSRISEPDISVDSGVALIESLRQETARYVAGVMSRPDHAQG